MEEVRLLVGNICREWDIPRIKGASSMREGHERAEVEDHMIN